MRFPLPKSTTVELYAAQRENSSVPTLLILQEKNPQILWLVLDKKFLFVARLKKLQLCFSFPLLHLQ